MAAEEYFYIVWPVLLILLVKLRLSWRTIAIMLVVVGLGMYAVRVYAAFTTGAQLPLYRMGGIAIGCAVALIIAETKPRGSAVLNVIIGVAGLSAAWIASGPKIPDSFAPLLTAIATTAIIYAVSSTRRTWLQRVLETRPMVFIGKISYELYLWHVPILIAATMYLGAHRVEIWWWVYPLVFGVSIATHFGFRPLQNKLRDAVQSFTAQRQKTPSDVS